MIKQLLYYYGIAMALYFFIRFSLSLIGILITGYPYSIVSMALVNIRESNIILRKLTIIWYTFIFDVLSTIVTSVSLPFEILAKLGLISKQIPRDVSMKIWETSGI